MSAIGVTTEMNKILRLITFQVGQQIIFTGFPHHLRRDMRQFFHLRSEIERSKVLSGKSLSSMQNHVCANKLQIVVKGSASIAMIKSMTAIVLSNQ